MKNEKGFTLVEMLIVLMIISVLVLISIPNVLKHFQSVDAKGCDAYIKMVQSQVQAYKIDHNKYPSVADLLSKKYLTSDKAQCPDGRAIVIDGEGKVDVASQTDSSPADTDEGADGT